MKVVSSPTPQMVSKISVNWYAIDKKQKQLLLACVRSMYISQNHWILWVCNSWQSCNLRYFVFCFYSFKNIVGYWFYYFVLWPWQSKIASTTLTTIICTMKTLHLKEGWFTIWTTKQMFIHLPLNWKLLKLCLNDTFTVNVLWKKVQNIGIKQLSFPSHFSHWTVLDLCKLCATHKWNKTL
jgi:hypothetical protein